MSRKKKKTAAAAPAPAATPSPARSQPAKPGALRLITPLSKGQRFHLPRLTHFGRVLWRGGARFTRTFLSVAGLLLRDSTRASLQLVRGAPEWVRVRWAQGRAVAGTGARPDGSSASASSSSSRPPSSFPSSHSPSSSLPKDALDVSNSGWMLQQFKAVEELQRTARLLVEQRVRKSDVQFDHHVERTEGDVKISIRSTSSIRIECSGENSPRDGGKEDGGSSGRIESAGESGPRDGGRLGGGLSGRIEESSPRDGGSLGGGPSARIGSASELGAASSRKAEKADDIPSTRMDTVGERSAAGPRQIDKADDAAPVMTISGSEPSSAMPRVDDESNDKMIIRRYPSGSSPRDDTEDQVLAHMDLVMQKMPIPAQATVTDKRGKDHNKNRHALRSDVLRKYGAANRRRTKVWCCIRREWMNACQVRTAHICPVNLSEAYLQYVFGDKGPHIWNAQNAIPISCELEEALDAGQLVIVPAEPEQPGDSDDLFSWDAPDPSISQTNRFKVVVFDDAVRTNDGKLKARDLHGRLLGFPNPNFRPGMRYICFNVVTTLARRMRYQVRGSHKDLEKLGNSRFLLKPGKFVRDSWLLKMCELVGIDLGPKPASKKPTSRLKPDRVLDINCEKPKADVQPDVALAIDGTSNSQPDLLDISDSTLEIAPPKIAAENDTPLDINEKRETSEIEHGFPPPKPSFALNIDEEMPNFFLHLEGSDISDLPHLDINDKKEMDGSDMSDLPHLEGSDISDLPHLDINDKKDTSESRPEFSPYLESPYLEGSDISDLPHLDINDKKDTSESRPEFSPYLESPYLEGSDISDLPHLDINDKKDTSESEPEFSPHLEGSDISDLPRLDINDKKDTSDSMPEFALEMDGSDISDLPYLHINDKKDMSESKPEISPHLEGSDMSESTLDIAPEADAENKSDLQPECSLDMDGSDMTDFMLDMAPNDAESNKSKSATDITPGSDGSDTSDSTLDTAPDTDAESNKDITPGTDGSDTSDSTLDTAPDTDAESNKSKSATDITPGNSKIENNAELGFMELFGPYDTQKSSWNIRRGKVRIRRRRRSAPLTSSGIRKRSPPTPSRLRKPYTDLTPIRY